MRAVSQNVVVWLTAFGFKALGALGFWIVGRWLIHVALSFVGRALRSQNVDPTLQAYLGSIIAVALNVVLVVAILGFFGIETTSFAALLAAAGIAIGAAWAGLLANFAAGRGSVPSVATRVRAQGTFVNWESPPVHAVDMTPDGSTLLVTNTSDDRLEVFTLGGSLPVHAASIPVGLDPVRCR